MGGSRMGGGGWGEEDVGRRMGGVRRRGRGGGRWGRGEGGGGGWGG